MKRKLTALLTSAALTMSTFAFPVSAGTENTARQMEYLDRGTVAVAVNDGVYLSWRLLGTESLENQAFDIYRDGERIHTTGAHDATCYTDKDGTADNKYIVVPANTVIGGETAVTPWTTNNTYTPKGGFSNSVAYKDILFAQAPANGVTPDDGQEYTYEDSDGNTQTAVIDGTYTYSPNDMSVGDLDGDGEYELVVKWDPSNAKDNSKTGYTGNVYFDAYKLDGTHLWRMDLGPNIRAGAHYTQFLVYDFDGDGKSELVLKTAPGSKDGNGRYVSEVGKDIGEVDDSKSYVSSSGLILDGPEYLTVFEGETGRALQTVLYDPPRTIHNVNNREWGDNYGNRCERYLAGVAYLNGKTPSIIEVRGYYTYAYVAAYNWDGENLTEQWLSSNDPVSANGGTGCTVKYADGTTKNDPTKTLYGQGAHSLSVADADNDGYDEIIFGSAILDHDGTVLLYDGRGHGDAEHVSDFDNDGNQEVFMVHEAGKGNSDEIPYAIDVKRYNGDVVLQAATGDIGRGVMANVDDDYAKESGDLALFWSAGTNGIYNMKGESVGNRPVSNAIGFQNSLIYWDGDLGRELLDKTTMGKHSIANNGTTRIYYSKNNSGALPGVSCINGTKSNAGVSADILGDWREEVVFPLSDGTGARLFFSTIPTEYRLTTLMHDSQYRCAVAWQNVAYNQPPHQSYYIGSAALAVDESGNTLNYLAPATEFDTIEYPDTTNVTPRPTLTPTPEPVTETVEIPVEADTYLVYNDTQTVHGNDAELKINMATAMYTDKTPGLKEAKGLGFLRFNLSEYAKRKVVSATLRLYGKHSENSDGKVSTLYLDYCSKDDWNENSFTADDITIRGEGTPLSSLGLSDNRKYNTSYQKIEFDVTNAVKADSDNVYTFTLWTGTGREQTVAAKEYTGTDASGAVLVVELEKETEVTPTPSVAPTASPTVTPSASPTATPSASPTATPSASPTVTPSASPTATPSASPTATPSVAPTASPAVKKINAVVSVTENGANCVITPVGCESGKLISALFDDDGMLIGVDIADYDGTNAVTRDIDCGGRAAAAAYVKIVLWKDFDRMRALCSPCIKSKAQDWK